jgi:hypothetical protein
LNPLCDGEPSEMVTSIMAEAKMSAFLSKRMLLSMRQVIAPIARVKIVERYVFMRL